MERKDTLIDRLSNIIEKTFKRYSTIRLARAGIASIKDIYISVFGITNEFINFKIHAGSQTGVLTTIINTNYQNIIDEIQRNLDNKLFLGSKGYYLFNLKHEGQILTLHDEIDYQTGRQYKNWILSIKYKLILFSDYVSYLDTLPDELVSKMAVFLDNKSLSNLIDIPLENSLDWKLMIKFYDEIFYKNFIEVIRTFYNGVIPEDQYKDLFMYINTNKNYAYYRYNGDEILLLRFIGKDCFSEEESECTIGESLKVLLSITKFKIYQKYLNNFYDKFFILIKNLSISQHDLFKVVDIITTRNYERNILYIINDFPREDIIYFPPISLYYHGESQGENLLLNPYISYYILTNPRTIFFNKDTPEDKIYPISEHISFYIKLLTTLYSKFGVNIFNFITDYFLLEFHQSASDHSGLKHITTEFMRVIYPAIIIEMNKRGLI